MLLAMAGTALQLSGCGGGGGGGDPFGGGFAGISTGGTGSFTVGPISGFGSIIVNGIRYDDAGAQVSRLDDGIPDATRPLRLGMMVSIQGSPIAGAVVNGTATATANRILYNSEWLGPIDLVSPAAGTFTVLGQAVRTTGATIFEGAGVTGVAGLSIGTYAEVYGFIDAATGTLQATRVELSTTRPEGYRLSGVVSGLDSTAFSLGTARILIGDAGASTWATGSFVRATLKTTPDGRGRWIATRITTASAVISDLLVGDDEEVELKGSITAMASATRFAVNGIPVDASKVANLPALGLALGALVKVEGTLASGTVIASEIEVEDAQSAEAEEFEIHGTLEQLDAVRRTFVVRDYAFHYDDSTLFEPTGWTPANGAKVEIKATLKAGRLWVRKLAAEDD